MTKAIVLVPPFINLAFGPLLGPAMLIAAGKNAGHDVSLIDFNERWIRARVAREALDEARQLVGDHDRPSAMRDLRSRFLAETGAAVRAQHEEIHARAKVIADSALGEWIATELGRSVTARPEVIGLSIMYRDQLEPALAITAIARRLYPHVLVIWGGAHVTAMREEIARDVRYGWGIDAFAFGYAEATWVDVLDAIEARAPLPDELVRAGERRIVPAREDLSVVSCFGDLSIYNSDRVTLPLQASRGCTYGICTYCTYPHIEGRPRRVPPSIVRATIEQAVGYRAALSFKDSLVDGELLLDLADWIGGRVEWSACTKLDAKLPARLDALAAGGCKTLEIGLETLEPRAQHDARKKQTLKAFAALLDAAARAGIVLVINYITGFPRCDPEEEHRWRSYVEKELACRRGLVATVEHHTLQVERLSALARDPQAHGLRITSEWPWSSVLDWEPVSLIQLGGRWGGSRESRSAE